MAILAAILIPGLLKWIDRAKDGHYLLKAGGSTDLIGFLGEEIEKFTDATVEKIEIYGNSDGGTPEKWKGNASGFEITFIPSGETEPITASLLPGSDRWGISKSSDGTGGESGDKFDNDPDPKVREANAVWKAMKAAVEQTEGVVELIHRIDGTVEMKYDGYTNFRCCNPLILSILRHYL